MNHNLSSSLPVSSHLISSHLDSTRLVPSHLVSSRLVSSHLVSSHLVSSHLVSSHLVSSRLVSSLTLLVSSRLISSCPVLSHPWSLLKKKKSEIEELRSLEGCPCWRQNKTEVPVRTTTRNVLLQGQGWDLNLGLAILFGNTKVRVVIVAFKCVVLASVN
jgi:hypothetical protein